VRCSATVRSNFLPNLTRSTWDSAIRQLLKAIAKTIEPYEEGELPRSTTIHFYHDDNARMAKRE